MEPEQIKRCSVCHNIIPVSAKRCSNISGDRDRNKPLQKNSYMPEWQDNVGSDIGVSPENGKYVKRKKKQNSLKQITDLEEEHYIQRSVTEVSAVRRRHSTSGISNLHHEDQIKNINRSTEDVQVPCLISRIKFEPPSSIGQIQIPPPVGHPEYQQPSPTSSGMGNEGDQNEQSNRRGKLQIRRLIGRWGSSKDQKTMVTPEETQKIIDKELERLDKEDKREIPKMLQKRIKEERIKKIEEEKAREQRYRERGWL